MKSLNEKTIDSIDITIERLKVAGYCWTNYKGLPPMIEELISDIEDIKCPTGPFSYWAEDDEEKRHFWGNAEWYYRHALQPIGDYWHNDGKAKYFKGICYKELEERIKKVPSIMDPEGQLQELYDSTPDFRWELLWNQIGIILLSSGLFVNAEWFAKNWFYKDLEDGIALRCKIEAMIPDPKEWIQKYFIPNEGFYIPKCSPAIVLYLGQGSQAVIDSCYVSSSQSIAQIFYCVNEEGDNNYHEEYKLEIDLEKNEVIGVKRII